KGKISAPTEIEPYIQSAINRKIDELPYKDLTGGGIVGKLKPDTCIYDTFYVTTSKVHRCIDTIFCILKAAFALTLGLPLLSLLTFFALHVIFRAGAFLELIIT